MTFLLFFAFYISWSIQLLLLAIFYVFRTLSLEVTRPKFPYQQMVSRKTNGITSATEGDPIVLRASYIHHFVVLDMPNLY